MLRRVQLSVKPLVHAFGHIHEAAGDVSFDNATLFANASTCTFHYQSLNPAIVVDLAFDLDPVGAAAELNDAGAGGATGATADDDDAAAAPAAEAGLRRRAAGPAWRPARAEAVASRVAAWSATEVSAWLDRQEAFAAAAAEAAAAEAAAAAAEAAAAGAGGGAEAVEVHPRDAAVVAATHAWATSASVAAWSLPAGVAACLRGLDGAGLLAVRPTDGRLDNVPRGAKAACVRAVRHLEAHETN